MMSLYYFGAWFPMLKANAEIKLILTPVLESSVV